MKSGVDLGLDDLEATPPIEDPWLLSLSDLVINLLAFMVVIISMSKVSLSSIDALPGAFNSRVAAQPNLKTLSADVEQLVQQEGLEGVVVAQLDTEGLAILIQDQIAFDSGVAELSSDGKALVAKIAGLVDRLPNRYRVSVEGHTDDAPISTPRFASNWELSAARALEVRKELAARGVDGSRLAISAFAETQPLPRAAGDSLDDSRRKDRRVVIRVH